VIVDDVACVSLFELCLSWLIEWKIDVGSSGDRLLVKVWL
jgi:hypothetical protein